MAHVFTPGLKVTERAVLRRSRRLPLRGEVVAKLGDSVMADAVVAKAQLPGKVFPINLSNMLHVDPSDVPGCMRVPVGGKFPKGVIVAETSGFFGRFKTRVKSPVDATLESVSGTTGQAMLREPAVPIEMSAYVDGEVVEILEGEGVVVETEGAFIQGIFGLGGEIHGDIAVVAASPSEHLDPAALNSAHRGKVVVAGAGLTREGFARAVDCGVAAVVVGGFDYQIIKEILGREMGVAITGNEELGTTLVITEGFGNIRMAQATFDLLVAHEGVGASVNGATQIRAGVMRPEIVIPGRKDGALWERAGGALGLEVGSRVRGIRDPYFGLLGEVASLPAELQTLPSGARVRVLEVLFDGGQRAVVPRANVEAIER